MFYLLEEEYQYCLLNAYCVQSTGLGIRKNSPISSSFSFKNFLRDDHPHSCFNED